MSEELPKGWVNASLEEVSLYIQREKSPKYVVISDLPVVNQRCVRWWGVDVKYLKFIDQRQWAELGVERYLCSGDILWNSTGTGTIGRACLYLPMEAYPRLVVDSHVTIVRTAKEMSSQYVFYFVMSPEVQKKIVDMQTGSTNQVELPRTKICSTLIPVAPIAEQARIVSKIDELFSSIDEGERALERVRKLVERYRQSVLKAAVTGELTREWREQHAGELESGEALLTRILESRRQGWEQSELAKMQSRPISNAWKRKYQVPPAPDLANMPCIPAGWTWVSLPTICSDDTGNGISVKGSSTPPGFPALRLDAMTQTGFDYSAIRYIPISEETARRLTIVEGDFFVSRANGTLRLVGRAVLASKPETPVVFPDTMIRYRPLLVPNLRGWLSTVWASPLLRSQIEKRAKTTAGIHKISQEDISSLALPLPSIAEQIAICGLVSERLAQADHALREALTARKLSASARQAILKSAFSGQLVPQDPTNEPASVLLERIAAERAAAPRRIAPKQTRAKKFTKSKAKA